MEIRCRARGCAGGLPGDEAVDCGTVRRRSPQRSCILARWLSNKTPETFLSWLKRPDNSLLVAVENGRILGVGGVTDAGEINLNYVSPDARFRGVSRAMLGALEARAAARGNVCCTLASTEPAHRFYRAAGYIEVGAPPSGKFGIESGYPMSKTLTAQNS